MLVCNSLSHVLQALSFFAEPGSAARSDRSQFHVAYGSSTGRVCLQRQGSSAPAMEAELPGDVVKLLHISQCSIFGLQHFDALAVLHRSSFSESSNSMTTSFLSTSDLCCLASVPGVTDMMLCASGRLNLASNDRFVLALAVLAATNAGPSQEESWASAARQHGFTRVHPGRAYQGSSQLTLLLMHAETPLASTDAPPVTAHASPIPTKQALQLNSLRAVLHSLQHQWHASCGDVQRMRWGLRRRQAMRSEAAALRAQVAFHTLQVSLARQCCGHQYCTFHSVEGPRRVARRDASAGGGPAADPTGEAPSRHSASWPFTIVMQQVECVAGRFTIHCKLRAITAGTEPLAAGMVAALGDFVLPAEVSWQFDAATGIVALRAAITGQDCFRLSCQTYGCTRVGKRMHADIEGSNAPNLQSHSTIAASSSHLQSSLLLTHKQGDEPQAAATSLLPLAPMTLPSPFFQPQQLPAAQTLRGFTQPQEGSRTRHDGEPEGPVAASEWTFSWDATPRLAMLVSGTSADFSQLPEILATRLGFDEACGESHAGCAKRALPHHRIFSIPSRNQPSHLHPFGIGLPASSILAVRLHADNAAQLQIVAKRVFEVHLVADAARSVIASVYSESSDSLCISLTEAVSGAMEAVDLCRVTKGVEICANGLRRGIAERSECIQRTHAS